MTGNHRSWWRRWLPPFSPALRQRSSAWRKCLMLEALEDRYMLSAYVVTSTADSGTGSLRDAITQVNAGAYNEIDFAIGTSGSAQTISPLSILPAITANNVYLNGLSQGGSGNTTQLITLNGAGAGEPNIDGLQLEGTGCILSGFIVEGFHGNDIDVYGKNNTIGGTTPGAGNVLLTAHLAGLYDDASGVTVQGNTIANCAYYGINVGASINTIGGTTAAARNVIYHDGIGVNIPVTRVLVEGNYIGTDATGTYDGVNGNDTGIYISGSNNTIGGTTTGARNLISHNKGDGIEVIGHSTAFASGTLVQGNYIGTDYTGTVAVSNEYDIFIANDIASMTIGGTTAGAGNVISGSTADGIAVGDGAVLIQGNFIGTTATGSKALGNSIGLDLFGGGSTIGGTTSAARNIISGNTNDGVYITFDGSGVLQGNYVGTDSGGNNALGNGSNGIEVQGSATLGGSVAGVRNVISGNGGDGVLIDGVIGSVRAASGVVIQGNYIGTNATGKSAVANSSSGIEVAGIKNTIGGSLASLSYNVISGSDEDGILLDSAASGNVVQGNVVGTNANGTGALGNGANGLEIASWNNTIGSSTWSARNVISGNSNDGILIDSSGEHNAIQGNVMGANVNSTAALANKNGVEIAGLYNTIGGSSFSTERNIISGNGNDGVLIDSSASGNALQNNFIGLSSAGNGLGNSGYGVSMAGSYTHEAGNFIANNATGGVLVSQGSNNAIQDDGTHANGSAGQGPGITLDSGTNNSIAAPSLATATLTGSTLTVTGTFNAPTANVTYLVYFYANSSDDPEGRIYLGRLSLTPTSTGTQSFTFTATTSVTGTDPLITATLTDNMDNTSAFSTGETTTS